MNIRDPLPQWNNFTVPELKQILQHCTALERLGIAQDEEMIRSIERDISLRERKIGKTYVLPMKKTTSTAKQPPEEELLVH